MAELKSAGFFNLNLRFLNDVDNAQISYMKGEQTVELRTAPDCVKPVIRNIEAVLTFVQPLNKQHGLSMMENIYSECPDNINTLANLIEMKKSFHIDTKTHEEKLKQMQSKDGNSLEQARCLLEIGYVLLSDLHTEVQKSVEEKLKDIMKQLEFQERSITVRQNESLQQAYQHLEKAKIAIQHVLPETCIHGTKREQDKAITYFENGLALIEPGNAEAGIWKHHLARAHSRIGAGDRNISTTTAKKHHMHCALQNFQECISILCTPSEIKIADPLKVYVARSYAYVGHLIATRSKEIKGTQEPIPSFVDKTLWDDPMEAFVRAHKMFDNDRVVHSRHGLTLKDKRFSAEIQKTDRLKNIDRAIELFNTSLRIEHGHNWFAYSQLVQAYLEKYKNQRQVFLENSRSNPKPKKSCLDEAIKNGERSIQQRVTSKTLLDITEAFYLKSMRLEKGKDGLDIVDDHSFLTSAQEYIQRAFDHHDCKEHEKLKVLFGKCLFHEGDRKAGIEAILDVLVKKRNTITEPHYFRELMLMMFNYFREWKDNRKNDVKIRQRRQKLRKIWCVLCSGKQTYKKRFKHPLIGILNLYPHEFIHMLMEVYRFKSRGKAEQELIDECVEALGKHRAQDVKRRLGELEKVQPDQSNDEVNVQRQGTASPYDYCLCYSQEDVVWIQTFIEERVDIQELNGKRCLKAEDLTFEDKLKFVFIISESFNSDKNCSSMLSTCKRKYPTSNRLVPILTHNSVKLPQLLDDVVPIDFTGLRNSYGKFISALQHPIDDFNVPGAASTPDPIVNIEGAADNVQENMDVDEQVPVKRPKRDEQEFHEGTSWADQVENGSGEARDDIGTEALMGDAGMDSGFVSQNG